MGNRFGFIIAACVILFLGLLVFNKKETNAPAANASATNHTQGTGAVRLIEYGDFECSGCYAYHPILKQVKEKYGDKITFQFRNFPLTQIHKYAMIAHRAAEASDKQGKFWEMHDLLYESQPQWGANSGAPDPTKTFEGFATQLGLNIDQYRTDMASSAVNDLIQADIRAGQELRFTSTPSFVLDGTSLVDPRNTLEYFSEKIDAALKTKNQQ